MDYRKVQHPKRAYDAIIEKEEKERKRKEKGREGRGERKRGKGGRSGRGASKRALPTTHTHNSKHPDKPCFFGT
jgi:hypothetical protein